MENNKLKMVTSFVVNNYRLEKLKSHLNEFNPLKVLKLNHYEIRHSNVLSWLFDPEENHNLRDLLFKKMILEVMNHDENIDRENPLHISETSIFLNSFHDLEVNRELPFPVKSENRKYKRYIDLVLVSHINKVVVIIENKIYANEGIDQLKDYYEYIVDEYPGYGVLPIFLTLNGDQPSEDSYFVYTYLDLYLLLNDVIPLKKDFMSDKVYSFINDYLCILQELTMTDSEYKEICEDLYREYSKEVNIIVNFNEKSQSLEETEHKQLYDIIRKYKSVAKYIEEHGKVDYFKKAFYQFIEEHSNLTYYNERHQIANAVFCYPLDYQQIPNYKGLTEIKEWYSDFPCPLIFDRREDHISLKFEVGHFKDEFTEERINFVEFLRKNTTYKITKSTKQGQIIKKVLPMNVQEWSNPEIILRKMNELYAMLETDEKLIMDLIREFWSNNKLE